MPSKKLSRGVAISAVIIFVGHVALLDFDRIFSTHNLSNYLGMLAMMCVVVAQWKTLWKPPGNSE